MIFLRNWIAHSKPSIYKENILIKPENWNKLKYDYKKFIKNKDIGLKKLEVQEKKKEVKVVKEEVKKTKAKTEKKTLEINQFDEWNKEYNENIFLNCI